MTTKNIQDVIEEGIEGFKNLPRTDDGSYCMECGGGIDEEKAVDWLRTYSKGLVAAARESERADIASFHHQERYDCVANNEGQYCCVEKYFAAKELVAAAKEEDFDEDLFRQSSWYKAEKEMIEAAAKAKEREQIKQELRELYTNKNYDIDSLPAWLSIVPLDQDIPAKLDK